MTDFKKEMEALQMPLKPDRVVWRVQQSGVSAQGKAWAMVLAYMDNRAVQERFDEVFGIAGWKNEFKTAPDGGTLCGISVKFGDEWVTKWDGAENTQVEAVKGGLSGSMKRAAVQWGVGRYLYDLPSTFATTSMDKKTGWNKAKDKSGKTFYWEIPKLPKWALPKQTEVKATPAKEIAENQQETQTVQNEKEEKLNNQLERALKKANELKAPMELILEWNKLPKAEAVRTIAKWIEEKE